MEHFWQKHLLSDSETKGHGGISPAGPCLKPSNQHSDFKLGEGSLLRSS